MDKMNEILVNIGLLRSLNIPNTTFTRKSKTLGSTVVLIETNIDEITTIIQSLKNKGSTGPFGSSNETLELRSPFIEPFL